MRLFFKILLWSLALVFIAFHFFTISNIRLQSDDMGYLIFIEHDGSIWKFYQNSREFFEAPLGYFLYAFPLAYSGTTYNLHYLQVVIINALLAFAVIRMLKQLGFLKPDVSKWTAYLTGLIFVSVTSITAWNTNTYQNAPYWFVGVYCYVFPIMLFMLSITWMSKAYHDKMGLIGQLTLFILSFLLANARINYSLQLMVIIPLFYLWSIAPTSYINPFSLIKNAFFRNTRFILIFISGFLSGTLYYVLAPGNLIRFKMNNPTTTAKALDISNIFSISHLCQQPILLLAGIIVLGEFAKKIISFNLSRKQVLIFISICYLAFVVNNFCFQLLMGNKGYGRVHFFSQIIFICGLVVAYLYVSQAMLNYLQHKIVYVPSLAVVGLLLVLVFVGKTFKSEVYLQKRFTKNYDERIRVIKKHQNASISCINFSRMPNSGILGFSDMTEIQDCTSARTFNWIYGQNNCYDNLCYEHQYKTRFRIVATKDKKDNCEYEIIK